MPGPSRQAGAALRRRRSGARPTVDAADVRPLDEAVRPRQKHHARPGSGAALGPSRRFSA
ncbi:hypothetical protein [Nocardiopsis dassonvillei]|uniref:hypothetical protein n=1 Tax=Nocardiopsis dassonvillei TaxID=2014 RepID=UPI003670126B